MSENKPLNLRQKLVQVYSEIDHVEKAGSNTKQNYKFVRSADVLRVVRDAFAKLGIYAQTNFELLGTYDIKTNSGGVMHTATVRATMVLFDTDSNETIVLSGLGDGADSGDKGIYKAQTGATENTLRNGLLLPDEADPEADESIDSAVDGVSDDQPSFQDAQRGKARPAQQRQPGRTTGKAAVPAATAQAAPAATAAVPAAPAGPPKAELPPAASTRPTQTPAAQTQAPVTAPAAAEASTATPIAASTAAVREPGEEPAAVNDDGSMPTEPEMEGYRKAFRDLGNDLSLPNGGKLKSSKNLPIERKVLVFLLSVTKAPDATKITRAQWDNFFSRVAALAGPAGQRVPEGLVNLATLINRTNGIEEKAKK